MKVEEGGGRRQRRGGFNKGAALKQRNTNSLFLSTSPWSVSLSLSVSVFRCFSIHAYRGFESLPLNP